MGARSLLFTQKKRGLGYNLISLLELSRIEGHRIQEGDIWLLLKKSHQLTTSLVYKVSYNPP